MKTAVIMFPASNCERDSFTVAQSFGNAVRVWHQDVDLPKVDLVILPGGFSYGDYLRSGAMAAHSNIMQAVKKHAKRGGYVLGICNGFQILTESGLLEGALMRNLGLKFISKATHLRVENNKTPFTKQYSENQIVRFPVAHHDGNFYADDATLQRINDEGRIVLRYCDENGTVNDAANINGSAQNIAGIINSGGNVIGMMPHPERACEELTGGIDGRNIFTSLLEMVA